jgi:hypothetical protein
MMTSRIFAVGLSALGVLALAGCETQVLRPPNLACDFTPYLTAQAAGPVILGPLPGTLSPVPLNTVRVIDPRIGNKVLPQSAMARHTETGTVEVQSRLVNCTDFPLQVEGRTIFLDENNFNVEPPSAWQRVFLPPRALGQYGEKSTDIQRVKNFTIELREGG